MFVLNPIHDMPSDYAARLSLSPAVEYNIRHSWANVFREMVLRNINESVFAPLYSAASSRPNSPVNVLIGFGILAAFLGMPLKELHQNLLTDLKVRYALDLMFADDKDFNDDGSSDYDPKAYVAPFSLMAFTRFIRRCELYRILTGGRIDLIHICLEDLFAKMAVELEIDGKIIRMDSMMIESYIKTLSRKELLYVANALVAKELRELGHELPEGLRHYLNADDHNVVLYHSGEKYETAMNCLIREAQELAQFCTENKCRRMHSYKVLKQIMSEQLIADSDGKLRLRKPEDGGLNSTIIQSPFDLDASFRTKNGQHHRGYAANLVEALGGWGTIVVSYQYEPNIYSDIQFYIDYIERYVDLDRFAKIPENVEMFPPLSELLKLMEEAQIQAAASNTVQEDAAPSASDNVSPVDPAHEDAVKADSDAESAAQEGSVPTEVTTNVSESETNSQTPAQSNDAAPGICPSPAPSTAEDERFEKPTMSRTESLPPDVLDELLKPALPDPHQKSGQDSLPPTDAGFMDMLKSGFEESDLTGGTKHSFAFNDGAFQSMETTYMSLQRGIVQIPTNLTGKPTDKFYSGFEFKMDGTELIKCPGGCTPTACKYCAGNHTCYAHFDSAQCGKCPEELKSICNPRKTSSGYMKSVSQAAKIRATYQMFRETKQFSIACRFRNGVETLPSSLRRGYGVDRLPVRGLIRSGCAFGFRVSALNFGKLLAGLSRKKRGQRMSLSDYDPDVKREREAKLAEARGRKCA